MKLLRGSEPQLTGITPQGSTRTSVAVGEVMAPEAGVVESREAQVLVGPAGVCNVHLVADRRRRPLP